MATSYKYFYIGWAPANGDCSSISTCTIAASSSKEACNIFRKKNPAMRIIGCIPTSIKPTKEKAK